MNHLQFIIYRLTYTDQWLHSAHIDGNQVLMIITKNMSIPIIMGKTTHFISYFQIISNYCHNHPEPLTLTSTSLSTSTWIWTLCFWHLPPLSERLRSANCHDMFKTFNVENFQYDNIIDNDTEDYHLNWFVPPIRFPIIVSYVMTGRRRLLAIKYAYHANLIKENSFAEWEFCEARGLQTFSSLNLHLLQLLLGDGSILCRHPPVPLNIVIRSALKLKQDKKEFRTKVGWCVSCLSVRLLKLINVVKSSIVCQRA